MDATNTPWLNELLASALICVVSLPLTAYVIHTSAESTAEIEGVVTVEEVGYASGELALPKGHHMGRYESGLGEDEKKGLGK